MAHNGNQSFEARHRDIPALLDLSARVGQDPLLIQGSNGNASIKLDGTLWIKASGKRLANANREETLVPVDLGLARKCVRQNEDIAQMRILGTCLRPSIETSMHCVLRDRVVLHVHSLNMIAWAIRRDAPKKLEELLSGLHWQWIPYVPSGVPLAQQIGKALDCSPDSNIFVLGNHGLVICGRDCESVESLLAEIERRVSIVPRSIPAHASVLSTLTERSTNWRLPLDPLLHALGTDPISTRILKGGILFPCQAIFLGSKIRTLPHSVPLSSFREFANGRDGLPKFVIIEGAGTIVNSEISSAEMAMLTGLTEVLLRMEDSAPMRYLTSRELIGLSGDGLHPYRVEPETLENARHA